MLLPDLKRVRGWWVLPMLGGLSALGFAPLGWWPLTLIGFALLLQSVFVSASWKQALGRGCFRSFSL
jgi:apolipoprotein N-acyltransferase